MSKKPRVELYSKPDCCLCDDAKAILNELRSDFDFELIEIDISDDTEIFEKYKERIPIGFINGRTAFKYRINREDLINKLLGAD